MNIQTKTIYLTISFISQQIPNYTESLKRINNNNIYMKKQSLNNYFTAYF